MPAEAVILVGGLGTRLKDLTRDKPKPMLEVSGRPFLEYLLLYLKAQGLRRFILATAYKGKVVRGYFKDGKNLGVEIDYADSHEKQLGTAGSIKLAEDLIKGDEFFALNGDVFFEISLAKLWRKHEESQALATLALAQVQDIRRFGSVRLNSNGCIEAFLEKKATQESRPGLINGGIYVFDKKILESIPKKQDFSLERDVFPKIASRSLYGVAFPKAYFIDIGLPEDYIRAERELPKRPFPLGILE